MNNGTTHALSRIVRLFLLGMVALLVQLASAGPALADAAGALGPRPLASPEAASLGIGMPHPELPASCVAQCHSAQHASAQKPAAELAPAPGGASYLVVTTEVDRHAPLLSACRRAAASRAPPDPPHAIQHCCMRC